jgi:hypothetical protein
MAEGSDRVLEILGSAERHLLAGLDLDGLAGGLRNFSKMMYRRPQNGDFLTTKCILTTPDNRPAVAT